MGMSEEKAQQLGTIAALTEDLVSVPSIHMVAHNHLNIQFPGNLTSSSGLRVHHHTWYTYILANTHTYKIKVKMFKLGASNHCLM